MSDTSLATLEAICKPVRFKEEGNKPLGIKRAIREAHLPFKVIDFHTYNTPFVPVRISDDVVIIPLRRSPYKGTFLSCQCILVYTLQD